MLRISAHLDEVYTCELGLGGSFAPKPGAAERYKVLVVLFSRMPPNIPQTLNQEFGGLGRAGLCQRYVGAFLQSTSWCIVIMVCHSPTVGVWSCPRLTALLDQGAPRAKLVETIGHMVAASQASWHQRSGQKPWPVQKVTDWICLFHLICSGSLDSIKDIYVYDIILRFVYCVCIYI